MSLSVLSYNIKKIKGHRGHAVNLLAIADYIAAQKCDVVLCQEMAEDKTSAAEPHCCAMAHYLDMDHEYGANACYEKGSHGNATFSALPMIQSHNLNISTSRFEYRGALHSEMRLADGSACHFFNVHFGLTPWQRKKQFGFILDYIATHLPANDAVVIAGDLNDFGGTLRKQFHTLPDFKSAHDHLGEIKSFPSHNPRFQLDHILYRHLTLVGAEVVNQSHAAALSDHLALRAEFVIN